MLQQNVILSMIHHPSKCQTESFIGVVIVNFNSHYEPVIKFIYSIYPTYAEEDQNVIT